ncbi:RNA polymerase sigma factor [Patescibacteria group bacterium]|nr:RNA polymerase sigma factor [Patescibacteria group bacterium]
MKGISKNKERELLKEANQGDEQAYAQIYEIYAAKLFRFIRFKVSSRELAEDITQEVFFKTWRYLIEPENKIKNIKAFLYRTARNLVIDFYIQKSKATLSLEDDLVSVDLTGTDSADHKIDVDLQINEIKLVLKKLSEQYQEVIILRFLDGLSISEISQILDKAKNSVYVLIHRALKVLKKELK